MDLGVRNPGIVVDDSVDEPVSQQLMVILAAGSSGRAATILTALSSSDVAPSTAGGNVAEFLDIDVDQIPGMVVLVAADRPTGDPVNLGQLLVPAGHQQRMHR